MCLVPVLLSRVVVLFVLDNYTMSNKERIIKKSYHRRQSLIMSDYVGAIVSAGHYVTDCLYIAPCSWFIIS